MVITNNINVPHHTYLSNPVIFVYANRNKFDESVVGLLLLLSRLQKSLNFTGRSLHPCDLSQYIFIVLHADKLLSFLTWDFLFHQHTAGPCPTPTGFIRVVTPNPRALLQALSWSKILKCVFYFVLVFCLA